jgi:hypothetical protein
MRLDQSRSVRFERRFQNTTGFTTLKSEHSITGSYQDLPEMEVYRLACFYFLNFLDEDRIREAYDEIVGLYGFQVDVKKDIGVGFSFEKNVTEPKVSYPKVRHVKAEQMPLEIE